MLAGIAVQIGRARSHRTLRRFALTCVIGLQHERHFGLGTLGVLQPWDVPGGAPGEELGGFVQLGLVGELRAHQLVSCGYRAPATIGPDSSANPTAGSGGVSRLVG
jgi:hypothetical protein